LQLEKLKINLRKLPIAVLSTAKCDHRDGFILGVNTKEGEKFQCTEECEESFQRLKKLLTSTPILRIANPNMDFVVCTDACKEGMGGVLSQDVFVICYKSRKLKEHEKLCHSRFGVGSNRSHSEEMETLPHGKEI
jgi:hypothetical protein